MVSKKGILENPKKQFPTGTTGKTTDAALEAVVYEDTLPEGMTAEDFKEKYAKVVWCSFYECKYNQNVKGAQRTKGTAMHNEQYKPIGTPANNTFRGVCSRDEIAVDFKTWTMPGGAKVKVPSCFVTTAERFDGHMDWSKMLQPDGTPYGGSLESQSAESGYSNEKYHT